MLGQLYIGPAFMLLSQPSRWQTTRPSAVFCRAAAFAETERAVDFLDVNAPVLYRLNGAGVL